MMMQQKQAASETAAAHHMDNESPSHNEPLKDHMVEGDVNGMQPHMMEPHPNDDYGNEMGPDGAEGGQMVVS